MTTPSITQLNTSTSTNANTNTNSGNKVWEVWLQEEPNKKQEKWKKWMEGLRTSPITMEGRMTA